MITHQPTHMLMICMSTSSLQKLCTSHFYWWRLMVHRWGSLILKALSRSNITFQRGWLSCLSAWSKRIRSLWIQLSGETHGPTFPWNCWVLLLYNSFGNHPDSSGKTADCELEKNFLKTAWVPAEVWPKTVTDDHKVDAEPLPIGKMYVLGTVDAA